MNSKGGGSSLRWRCSPHGLLRFFRICVGLGVFTTVALLQSGLLAQKETTMRRVLEAESPSLGTSGSTSAQLGRGQQEAQGSSGGQSWQLVNGAPLINNTQLVGDVVFLRRERLAFCPIAKAACAEWRKALRWMAGVQNWEGGEIHAAPANGLPLLKSEPLDFVRNVMADERWTKLVVVRDPAERLVSAFIQKCYQTSVSATDRQQYWNCPYLRIFREAFSDRSAFPSGVPALPDSSTDAAFNAWKWALGEVDVFRLWLKATVAEIKQKNCNANPHWVPQSCRCGIAKVPQAYTIVPFHKMAQAAASLAGRLSIDAPDEPTAAKRREEVNRFLTQRFASPKDTEGKVTNAAERYMRFYNPTMLNEVKEAYATDYRLFGAALAEP